MAIDELTSAENAHKACSMVRMPFLRVCPSRLLDSSVDVRSNRALYLCQHPHHVSRDRAGRENARAFQIWSDCDRRRCDGHFLSLVDQSCAAKFGELAVDLESLAFSGHLPVDHGVFHRFGHWRQADYGSDLAYSGDSRCHRRIRGVATPATTAAVPATTVAGPPTTVAGLAVAC